VSFLAENWILIAVAFLSGGMLVWPMVKKNAGGAVSVPLNEAVRLYNREKGVLIDVSEPAEYAAGHAAGARSIPFGQIEGHKQLPTNKALPVLLLCPNGSRSGRAAGLLRKAGFENAVAVQGGTAAWREANFPIEKDSTVAEGEKAKA
jgi:rhodanese-related sulfurtransferase